MPFLASMKSDVQDNVPVVLATETEANGANEVVSAENTTEKGSNLFSYIKEGINFSIMMLKVKY